MKAFVATGQPWRVLFGPGSALELGAELRRLGHQRALVLCTPGQRALAQRLAQPLGETLRGIFDGAVMHVPVEVAEAARTVARELEADVCVAVGGGSTIGLGKAIALTSGLPIVAVPTTFSGSEMTPIYGVTAQGQKQTGRDSRVLPQAVIYDPTLLTALPPAVAGPSALNAMAHCVEALYARDTNPIVSLMAEEGLRALGRAIPRVVARPDDVEACGEALYGAWLAGVCLGSVGMGVHHKLCHVLGGRYNLPHAPTHGIILPHAVAYNHAAAPEAMAAIARALGGTDPAASLFALARSVGAPAALRDIGMPEASLAEAARLAVERPYPNPEPLDAARLERLLRQAWEGTCPRASS